MRDDDTGIVYSRADYIRIARVHLREARVRRMSEHPHQRKFASTLVDWAANARRRAALTPVHTARQGDLFA